MDGRVLLAERLYPALRAGDRTVLREILAPEFIGQGAAGMPLGLGRRFEGAEAMQKDFWWQIGVHFAVVAEPEGFDPVGDDGLYVRGTYRGTARSTGKPVEARFVHMLTFAGERIAGLEQITDTAAWCRALEGPVAVSYPPYPGPQIDALETIEYEVRDHLAHVRLNRPAQRNAIDLRVGEEALAVARAIAADPTIRAVLISGHGPAFTVGGDIDYFLAAPRESFGHLAGRMTEPYHEALRILGRIDPPVVTAAHGAVAGGGLGLVYAADIVVAAESTVFAAAFSGIGLSGDGGGTWHLPRLIGAARARQFYLENLRVDARTALDWGMVAHVVPDDELMTTAGAIATRLAAGPTKAFGAQRSLLRESWGHTFSEQLRAETEGIVRTGQTADAQGAIQAFVDKRKPVFEGR